MDNVAGYAELFCDVKVKHVASSDNFIAAYNDKKVYLYSSCGKLLKEFMHRGVKDLFVDNEGVIYCRWNKNDLAILNVDNIRHIVNLPKFRWIMKNGDGIFLIDTHKVYLLNIKLQIIGVVEVAERITCFNRNKNKSNMFGLVVGTVQGIAFIHRDDFRSKKKIQITPLKGRSEFDEVQCLTLREDKKLFIGRTSGMAIFDLEKLSFKGFKEDGGVYKIASCGDLIITVNIAGQAFIRDFRGSIKKEVTGIMNKNILTTKENLVLKLRDRRLSLISKKCFES